MKNHLKSKAVPKILFIILSLFSIFLFSSCGTLERAPSYPSTRVSSRRQASIKHIVAPGETLWRISKIYNVPMASIMRVNRLRDKQELKIGQRLKIPHPEKARQVISLYPSHKWRYIIIHHSATHEGSSLTFNKYHQSKGWDGVGYDFIINNGKSGKPDGFIEITPRWLKQLDGAHCHASDMNTKGIGICLVGNFNEERPTKEQMASLAYLVNELRSYYKIPKSKILGHRDVAGSQTECPGQNFPWNQFIRSLEKR